MTYAMAGVDVAAGDRAVELMKDEIKATFNDTVLAQDGGFAGLVDASALRGMSKPLLATSTDGVGTKVAIAQQTGIHHTIGQDLVGMVVDDIVVVGAKPLFMTDYIACGRVDPEVIAQIVGGIARACASIDTPLIGGETAEHPGLMGLDEYDVAGAATGVVDAADVLGAARVREGDAVIGLASSGLHSNGYSLVRRVFADADWDYDRAVPELTGPDGSPETLAEALLIPTRLYTTVCLDMARAGRLAARDWDGDEAAVLSEAAVGTVTPSGLHALSHVTGGGLGANLCRVIPAGLMAHVDRSTWQVPAMFGLVGDLGRVPMDDLEATLNMGIGMVAIVDERFAEDAIALSAAQGIVAWRIGRVESSLKPPEGARIIAGMKGSSGGGVALSGNYRSSSGS
ncbi:MAG: phosphoribosylformylglycinamidine cyclo-ligase [Actinomycetaceae bacterium]|nr:phosphoribosylformylglycinamidine cyclo-ligase [Actinomycetaceae bacterium]